MNKFINLLAILIRICYYPLIINDESIITDDLINKPNSTTEKKFLIE